MEEARLRVNTPAALLIATGVVCMVLDLINVIWTIFGFLSPIFQVISTALQAAQASGDDEFWIAVGTGILSVGVGLLMAALRTVFVIIGLICSGITIEGGRRLMELRSRSLVLAGAVFGAAQPITWTLSGCMTSSCGACVLPIWLGVSVLGIVTAVLVISVMNEPDISDLFDNELPPL